MANFLRLGHMEVVPVGEERSKQGYYMPYHAVLKQDSSKKIEVVLNAF